MANSPKDQQLNLIRYSVIGMAVFIILGIAGFGYWYSAQNTSAAADLADGDYQVLARPVPDRGKTISVREFFSYACGHCNKFEPILNKWELGIDDDVELIKLALGGNRTWTPLARSYYAMSELGMLKHSHQRIYDGIHKRRLQLTTTKKIAEYLADDKISTRTFYATATNNADVDAAYESTQRLAARFGINSVPTLVVAGKYLVSTRNGTRYALKVVDELIKKERSLR